MTEKILVVDDEDIIRESLSYILKKEQYDVEEAANGKIAFDMLKETSYDLVITDIEMPEMKGIELLDEIKKMKDQIYLKRKPVSEVESLLEKTGFEIKDIKQKSFKMDYLDGTTMLNHYMIKYWFLPGWKHVLKEEDQERIFDLVEKKLNNVANKKGFISLTVPYVILDCYKQ